MRPEGEYFGTESREEEPGRVEILELSDFGGVPLEELAERSSEEILRKVAEDPRDERGFRKLLKLPTGSEFEINLKQAVPEILEKYRRSVELKGPQYREQAKHAAGLAVDRGYVENPRPVRVVLTDHFFRPGLRSLGKPDGFEEYDADLDTIFVEPKHPNAFVAHEVGHALSTDFQKARSGFKRVVRTADGFSKGVGNNLFNEGATVVWEELSVNDGSKTDHSDPTSLYGWGRDMVRSVTELSGLDDDDLLRAYFGIEEAREKYDRALAKRFGVTIEDLEGLSFRFDSTLTKRILRGEPVEEEVSSNLDLHSGKYARLLRVFPNLTLTQKRGR